MTGSLEQVNAWKGAVSKLGPGATVTADCTRPIAGSLPPPEQPAASATPSATTDVVNQIRGEFRDMGALLEIGEGRLSKDHASRRARRPDQTACANPHALRVQPGMNKYDKL